ncbi:hypothetical protein M408DRAFT_7778 [Serendipita vermifera MAFF 305830]|uniref:Uncharacterized protein n=1 Tax=Serendipita vermifera MAFF 305830 TaxID=933852 RepID=A0A0C2XMU3_SERVB|nr:hypothetical protein M408DRAFT_7778 [Serendipita vermifera MAFF 305830]
METPTEMAPTATILWRLYRDVDTIFASGNPVGHAGALVAGGAACHVAHPAHPGRRPSQNPFEANPFGNDWESTCVDKGDNALGEVWWPRDRVVNGRPSLVSRSKQVAETVRFTMGGRPCQQRPREVAVTVRLTGHIGQDAGKWAK